MDKKENRFLSSIEAPADPSESHLDRWTMIFASIPVICLICASFWGAAFTLPLAIIGFVSYGFSLYYFKKCQAWSKFVELKTKALNSKCDMITKSSHSFVVDMIVELRRPLHGIIGTKQLFEMKEDLSEEERGLFDVVDFCSNHMLQKLERIQFFSEIESHQTRFPEKNLHIRELIQRNIEKVKPLVGDKNIKLSFHVDDDVPMIVMAKKGALNVLLQELLTNAISFTAHGKVKVLCQLDPDRKDQLLFTVSDTGPGLSKKQFNQSFNTTNLVQAHIPWHERGTGLGLSIIKSLIRSLGGSVWIDSEKKHGCSFCFSFLVDAISDEMVTSSEGATVFDSESISTKKQIPVIDNAPILLVDDEPFARTVMHSMLSRMGYVCDIAKNGEEALQMCRDNDYQLIFMDIQMPVMDGWDATSSILKESRKVLPTIVALTSHTRPSDKKMCLEAGMKAFLSKPIKKDDLIEIMDLVDMKPTKKPKVSVPKEFEMENLGNVISLDDYRTSHPATKQNQKDGVITPQTYIINFDRLYNHYSEDFDRCQQILKRTIRAISPLMDRLQAAFRHNDFSEMTFTAHQLKGEFSFIMCDPGVKISDKIENTDTTLADKELLQEMILELEAIVSELHQEISQLVIDEKESA